MTETTHSISISDPHPEGVEGLEKIGLTIFGLGLLLFLVAAFGAGSVYPDYFFYLSIVLSVTGALIFIIKKYSGSPAGVKNNKIWFNALTARGAWGWILGIVLTGFYVLLYWFPQSFEHLIRMMDSFSDLIRGKKADQWFLYGALYTIAILVMGFKAIVKYRHSNYQIVRTVSIMFFQLGFAFLIPAILQLFNQPEFYFSFFWPLKQDYLFPSTVNYLTSHPGALGTFMVFWGAMMSFIAVPALTYFFDKRWYCFKGQKKLE